MLMHAHTNTHRRSPSPTRTLSLRCCQIKAWTAGHKVECTAAKLTADKMLVLKRLEQLAVLPTGGALQRRSARPGR